MAELKTKLNDGDVNAFLEALQDEKRKADSFKTLKLMTEVSGENAKMWGDSLIGFGSYPYVYSSGRTIEWPLVGFSPRKQALTLYIMTGFKHYDDLLGKLGKYKTGKACLYIKKLEDVDEDVLKELISSSINFLKKKYP